MTKTVAFYTLGCKVNQYESRHLEEQFRAGGYTVVDPSEPALVYVVNTCTVTRLADRKSRQFMRRAKRQNPDSIVVMMGCYPQTNPDETAQIPEADIILDNEEKKLAFHRVEAYVKQDVSQRCSPGMSPARKESPAASPPDTPTRALLKIQDGCDRFCSYCVIPYARGPVRSRPMEEILREAETLIRTGYRELVLTGINTALYGADLQESNHGVASVIDELCRLPGDFRIRLGSLEPTVVDAAYVEKLLVYDKLCHHLHLSVQSGSDRILKEMNRHYTVADYLRIVRVVRDADPSYGLTADIITGFPGETEKEFQESLNLIRRVGYLKVHGFPYSKRPHTSAGKKEGALSSSVKKERNRQLIKVADAVALTFLKSLQGQTLRVLPEEVVTDKAGRCCWKGHADNFVTVYGECSSAELPAEGFVEVTVGEPYSDGVKAGKELQDDRMHIL